MTSFQGKVVVVTGGSAGIGESCARKFVAGGAKVALAARSSGPLEKLAAELGNDRALAVPTDVGSKEACSALLARTEERFGPVDILVNNAGFNSRGPLQTVSADRMLQILDVNLRAPILLTRLALPSMLERNTGCVVNVASLAGRIPLPDEATYSATKFGLRAFSFSLAEELRETGVRVSVVSPGPVDTGFIMDAIDEVPDLVFSQPMSSSDEIADLVLACAIDGKRERVRPAVGAKLATLGYLLPRLSRFLRPMMERRGRHAKAKFRARSAT